MTSNHFNLFELYGLTYRKVAVFGVLATVAAVLEGFGVAMFLPVLEFMQKGAAVLNGPEVSDLWRKISKFYSIIGIEPTLKSLLVVAIGLMLLRVFAVYGRQVYVAYLHQHIQHSIRMRLFDAYMAMEHSAFQRLSTGGLINILTTECQHASGSFAALFALLANIVMVIGFVIVLFWLSWQLTILAVLFLGASGLAVAFYTRHSQSNSYAASKSNSRYSHLALERLSAFRLSKLTANSEREAQRVGRYSDAIRKQYVWRATAVANVDLIMESMAILAGGVILFVAAEGLGLSLAEVGVFVMILLRLLPLTKEAMKSHQTYQNSSGSRAAVANSFMTATQGRERRGGTRRFEGVTRSIEFQNIGFHYPGTEANVLTNVSVSFSAGATTALVGPSGAGKSTMADLIPSLHAPTEGRILFDGIDSGEFDLASLRRGVAFVSQDAAILDDTVAENLRFVRPNATDAQLWDALDRAQAADFVKALELGLETRLGERGTRLSGGQKQRISLARALLQDASLLVLDEPTSALDADTERDIQQAMSVLRASGRVTVVVIAHSLSTIRDADQIIVMNGGRLVECGSHEELLVSEEWYSRVAGYQTESGVVTPAAPPLAANAVSSTQIENRG
jgi:subfamily B ATP-binding cassette protein MsbA